MKAIEVRAHNVANTGNDGFKAFELATTDLAYSHYQRAGVTELDGASPRPVGVTVGSGAKVSGVFRINTQGGTKHTDQPLDMLISGTGYFGIQLPNGRIAYTRNGRFHRNNEGRIANAQGFELVSGVDNIPDNLDIKTLTINPDGRVQILDGNNILQDLGNIPIFKFANEEGLLSESGGLMFETEASGPPVEGVPKTENYGELLQRALEESNVSPVKELTALIEAQRAYELGSKVIKAVDDMLQAANNIK